MVYTDNKDHHIDVVNVWGPSSPLLPSVLCDLSQEQLPVSRRDHDLQCSSGSSIFVKTLIRCVRVAREGDESKAVKHSPDGMSALVAIFTTENKVNGL